MVWVGHGKCAREVGMIKTLICICLFSCLSAVAQDGVFHHQAYAGKYYVLTVTGKTAILITPEDTRIEMTLEKEGYYTGGGFFKGWYSAKWLPNGFYKGDTPCYTIKKYNHMI